MLADRHEMRLVGLVGLVAVAFGVGLWWPQHCRAVALRARIAVAEARLVQEKDTADQASAAARDVNALRAQLAALPKQLPSQGDVADLLRQLAGVGAAQRLESPETIAKPATAGRDYGVIGLSLKFNGSFPAAYGFIQGVESLRRPVWIEQLQMRRSPRGEGDLLVQLELASFYLPSEPSEEARP